MIIEYKGYKGDYTYSSEHACFYGKIINNEYAYFKGKNVKEMMINFYAKVDDIISFKENIKFNKL